MNIPFEKFSSYGNNFVIVDEILNQHIPESNKSDFAVHVTDANFGIGSDGFIVIQPFNRKKLLEINSVFSYWESIDSPLQSDADYIFRMFEPDGTEALCCGNGLICIAYYLYKTIGLRSIRVLTEIPNGKPVVRTLGYDDKKQNVWVNMGTPSKPPFFLFNSDSKAVNIYENGFYKIDFDINLDHITELNDIRDFASLFDRRFYLTGYLVFTGEPHLIFLFDSEKYNSTSAEGMFVYRGHLQQKYMIRKNGRDITCDFLYLMGKYFNNNLRDIFPYGVNISFVNYIKESNIIEQRCFERGIEKETLACGTGMVASAYLLHTLGMVKNSNVCIHPVKCRSYKPGTQVEIEIIGTEYLLYGMPLRICNGSFLFETESFLLVK